MLSKTRWRILLFVLFFVTMLITVKLTGVGEWLLDLENLRNLVEQAGIWGILLYMGIFIGAAMLNIPGTAFLVAAVLSFGYVEGASITYIAALIGAIGTFYFGRLVGGKALHEIRNHRVRKIIQQAENRPITTLLLLRTAMQLSPMVGYTLALTNIQSRHYIIGNIIGIAIPVLYITLGVFLFQDQILTLFGIEL